MPAREAAGEAMRRADDGLPKLWTIHQALCLRREQPQFFGADAGYSPLRVKGAKACHAIAYLRGTRVATVVPRMWKTLDSDWQQTTVELPDGEWANRLTGSQVSGGQLRMEDVLREFPVALMVRA